MLKKQMIGIKDVKASGYAFDPIFSLTLDTAKRTISEICRNPELVFIKNPDDYHFFLLGEFDVVSGVVTPNENGPEFLYSARDAIGGVS